MNTSSPFQDETLAQPVAPTSGYPDESAALPALCDREAFQRRLDVVLRMAEKQRSSFAVLLLEAGLPCDASGQADARQLAAVASAIRMAVRLTDTVARLKNSEFGIILSVGNEEGAQRVARKIVDAIEASAGPGRSTHPCIGMAMHPAHGSNAGRLLRAADGALYLARHQLNGIVVAASSGQLDKLPPLRRESLAQQIGEALSQDEFVLRYQPIHALGSGQVVGCEALARWQHPELGVLAPAEFLHFAERDAAIEALSLRLLDQALTQASRWRTQGLPHAVSINLTPRLLANEGLEHILASRLHALDLPPACLTLELRDEDLAGLPPLATRTLFSIAAAGIPLAIDNFGRGSASLRQLRDLPFSTLKLDPDFVARIDQHEADARIIESLVHLGAALGKQVIAKGVESCGVENRLRAMGCTHAQGFAFAGPLEADDFAAHCDKDRAASPAAGA